MKKIFTLALLMFTVSATFAQGYVFTDKDGNELTEGANLTISIAEEDPFGDVLMNSGLSIKNVSACGFYPGSQSERPRQERRSGCMGPPRL